MLLSLIAVTSILFFVRSSVFADPLVPGVLPYDPDAVAPAGFVKMVDDTNNPQEMIFMRQESYYQ